MFNIDMEKIKQKAAELKDAAVDAAVKSVNVAEKTAAVAKIKFKIKSKEVEIKGIYKELGEIVYTAYKNGENADEKIAEKCVAIDKLNDEIDDLKTELGTEKEETAVFMEEPEAVEAEIIEKSDE